MKNNYYENTTDIIKFKRNYIHGYYNAYKFN